MEARRFIPTRVGQTSRADFQTTPLRDGSSPRAWGRLRHAKQIGRGNRFIPTRVGQTLV